MAVSITWSLTSGGVAVTSSDHGNAANGAYTSPNLDVYLRHDGVNPITNAGFYFKEVSTGYEGAQTAPLDFVELRAWGDGSGGDHGGIQVNFDPLNASGYNTTTWDLSDAAKQTGYAFTMHTGVGDSADNAVLLTPDMGASITTEGELPAGAEARFLTRIWIPTNEDTTGLREVDQVLKYTYTS